MVAYQKLYLMDRTVNAHNKHYYFVPMVKPDLLLRALSSLLERGGHRTKAQARNGRRRATKASTFETQGIDFDIWLI